MEIYVAKYAGFCYGVKRAVELAKAELKTKNYVATLGSLIHNPQMMEELKSCGLKQINSISGIKSPWTIIIPAHGVPHEQFKKIKDNKLGIVDATCVFVRRAQKLVKQLVKDNCGLIIILGDKLHPEVQSLLSYAGKKAVIIDNICELKKVKFPNQKIGFISQTTQPVEKFQQFVDYLKIKTKDLEYYNTICEATAKRQKVSAKLASEVELMLVVGGKNSANTVRLKETCLKYQKNTYHIENVNEIKKEWLKNKTKIGITAGASTPEFIINNVIEHIKMVV